MAHRILLVDPHADSSRTERMLADAGYFVRAARTFEQATELLAADVPDLLITALRLGAFNGLHLVIRSRALHPRLAAIVTTDRDEVGLSNEVRQHGARLLTTPLEARVLLGAVAELLGEDATDPTQSASIGAPRIRSIFERPKP